MKNVVNSKTKDVILSAAEYSFVVHFASGSALRLACTNVD